jgi:hypothetical protein
MKVTELCTRTTISDQRPSMNDQATNNKRPLRNDERSGTNEGRATMASDQDEYERD